MGICVPGAKDENDAGDLTSMAWFDDKVAGLKHKHIVGQKQSNAFGLYDMHGNMWEWCEDWYHNNYAGAPVNGAAWLSGGEEQRRVHRGGAWDSDADNCRSAFRGWNALDGSDPTYGLRVVADAPFFCEARACE
jgi:formylglycine-generating enzyme required for sulfatase activity